MELSARKTKWREEYRKRIQEFRLLDDEFMSAVFGDNIEATQLILNIILQRSDLVVTKAVGQREIKNVSGHSVRLDVNAMDQAGIQYDIEIQRAGRGAAARRARFYSSMLDTILLKPGQNYMGLAETYVIFITETDVLGAGYPVYYIDRRIQGLNVPFGDGSHIVYVNGAYQDESDPIGRLMYDFHCKNADDMHYDVLAKRVRYFKQSEGGQEDMSRIMEELCAEVAAEAAAAAAAEAAYNKSVDLAVAMLKDGMDIQSVSKYSGLPLEEVEALAGQEGA